MKIKKENKLKFAKRILNKEGLYYSEFPNGQLQVDKVNYWATKEKWYDSITETKGVGINSFLAHIKSRNTTTK